MISNAEGLMQAVLLALPVAVLLTLLVLLRVRWKKKRGRALMAYDNASAPLPENATDMGAASAPSAVDDVAALQAVIATEQASGATTALAPMFLELARLQGARGATADRMASLRSAAGLGSRHGPASAHALARLELAEAAFEAGDLTGACEQWQLARMAYSDDGQKDAHARVEKLMRDHGCPTDWVLTDF